MSCYNPLINFVIFCISMLMITLGMYWSLEYDRTPIKGIIISVIGLCIFLGLTCYLFDLRDNNIPNCNVVVEKVEE